VGEIHDGQEEPDDVNRPESTARDDTGAARQHIEPRSRAVYAVDLERRLALLGFEPRRAGLPEVGINDGQAYLDKHHVERPGYPSRVTLHPRYSAYSPRSTRAAGTHTSGMKARSRRN